jgi:hypothetical protein
MSVKPDSDGFIVIKTDDWPILNKTELWEPLLEEFQNTVSPPLTEPHKNLSFRAQGKGLRFYPEKNYRRATKRIKDLMKQPSDWTNLMGAKEDLKHFFYTPDLSMCGFAAQRHIAKSYK